MLSKYPKSLDRYAYSPHWSLTIYNGKYGEIVHQFKAFLVADHFPDFITFMSDHFPFNAEEEG